jgi:hypothetical protein
MKLKVGLKYCGGCNPRYNRVALVRCIEKKCGDIIEFVDPRTEGVDFILAVHGCEISCANLEPFDGIIIKHVSRVEDAERLIEQIQRCRDESSAVQSAPSE